jgi:O-antigen/teichoic acid export membrane protein
MSSTAKNTLRSTLLLVAFEIANPLLSLLLVGTMARRLGPEGTGAYNLLLNFFFVATSLTSLGLNSLITREVSKDRGSAQKFLTSAGSFGLVVSVAIAAGVILVVKFAGYPLEIELGGWLVALSLFPSIVILYSEAIFIAFEKVQYIVILAMVENIGRVATGLWLLHHGYGVVALIASFTFFRFLTLALNLTVFRTRIGPLDLNFDADAIKELTRNVPVFGSIFVIATFYWRTDVFILSKLASIGDVGLYTTGYRLFAIAQVVPKSFNTSIYPVFSKLFHHSQDSFRKANSLSIRYILVVLLPMAAGIFGLADPIVRLLFGEMFAPAAGVLKIVIWTLVPYGIVRVLASGLFASNRQVIDLKVNLMALLTNIILNFALIPRFGILGCAWATMLSIWIFLAFQMVFLKEEIYDVLRQAEIMRPAVAAGGILVWLEVTESIPLILRIIGGALIYGILLALLRVVRIADLRAITPNRLLSLLPEEHDHP